MMFKDMHEFRKEYFVNSYQQLKLNIDLLAMKIDDDAKNGLKPMLVIYTIRDVKIAEEEIPKIESLCKSKGTFCVLNFQVYICMSVGQVGCKMMRGLNKGFLDLFRI